MEVSITALKKRITVLEGQVQELLNGAGVNALRPVFRQLLNEVINECLACYGVSTSDYDTPSDTKS